MKSLIKIRELFWPMLEPFTDEQIKKEEELNRKYGNDATILNDIRYINDDDYAEKFFKTASELFEDEKARLKTVEAKSVTLLSATGLIITLVVNFSNQIILGLNSSTNKLIWWLILICFAFTVAYFFTAVIYSLRGLERKGYYQLDIKDIIDSQLQDKKSYLKKIAALTLANRVKNYKVINSKVDCAVMSHLFFKRGIVALIITAILYIFSKVNYKFLQPELIPIVYILLLTFVVVLVVVDLILCFLKRINNK